MHHEGVIRVHPRWVSRRATAFLVLAAVTVVSSPHGARAALAPTRPNIVIIMTDDQRWDTVAPRYMPVLSSIASTSGVSFTNSFVSNPLCCPSRVTTLTGKYSFTTGVYGNRGTWGGYDASRSFGAMDDTIATDLRSDGYATALVGKYLNGYNPRTDYT